MFRFAPLFLFLTTFGNQVHAVAEDLYEKALDKTLGQISSSSESLRHTLDHLLDSLGNGLAWPLTLLPESSAHGQITFLYIVGLFCLQGVVIYKLFKPTFPHTSPRSLLQTSLAFTTLCVMSSILHALAELHLETVGLYQATTVLLSCGLFIALFWMGLCLHVRIPFIYGLHHREKVLKKVPTTKKHTQLFQKTFLTLLLTGASALGLSIVASLFISTAWIILSFAAIIKTLCYGLTLSCTLYILTFERKSRTRFWIRVLASLLIILALYDLTHTFFASHFTPHVSWANYDLFLLLLLPIMLNFFSIIGERISLALTNHYPILKFSESSLPLPRLITGVFYVLASFWAFKVFVSHTPDLAPYGWLADIAGHIVERCLFALAVIGGAGYLNTNIRRVIATLTAAPKNARDLPIATAKFIAIISAIGWVIPSLIWGIAIYLVMVEFHISPPYIAGTFGFLIAFAGFTLQKQIANIVSALSFILRGILLMGQEVCINPSASGGIRGRIESVFLQFIGVRDTSGHLHYIYYGNIKDVKIYHAAYAEITLVTANTSNLETLESDILTLYQKAQKKGLAPKNTALEFVPPETTETGNVRLIGRVEVELMEKWRTQALLQKYFMDELADKFDLLQERENQ